MAVPQAAFTSAQPVARAAVAVTPQQIASASVNKSAAVAPTRQSVLGAHASTANHVPAPPAATMNRQVVANHTPPPPPLPSHKDNRLSPLIPDSPCRGRSCRRCVHRLRRLRVPMSNRRLPASQPRQSRPVRQIRWAPAECQSPAATHSTACESAECSSPRQPVPQLPANQPNRPPTQPAPTSV